MLGLPVLDNSEFLLMFCCVLRPNMAAINEYKKKEEVYMARVAELDAMTAARDEQKKHHDDLR